MTILSALQLDLKQKIDRIAELEDENAYLKAQLMDESIVFPSSWKLRPLEQKVLRHLLKRSVATTDSLMAVLYSDRGGDEPDDNVLKICVYRIRRVLGPLGIKIQTMRGEGYRLEQDMKHRIQTLCETDRKDAPA
ncbi:MAG: helix-turn-helix domain-containing protein [Pseudomonadota bacterium]